MENNIIDEVVKGAQKAGRFIADKADVAADFVKLEYKASSLRGKLNDAYRELGKLYFSVAETGAESAAEMDDVIEQIKGLNAELAAVEDDMKSYKRVCPSCGAKNSMKADYCQKCGTKLDV